MGAGIRGVGANARQASASTDSEGRDPDAFAGYCDSMLEHRIASDEYADVLPDRYRFDGTVLSWDGTIQQYLNHRRGERASVESDDSPVSAGTLRRRAIRKNAVIHRADRTIQERMTDPAVCLLTYSGQFDPTEDAVVDYAGGLSDALDSAFDTLRYQVEDKRDWSVDYVCVLGGTDRGIPHYHLVVWIDQAGMSDPTVSGLRDALQPAVQRFRDELGPTRREAVGADQDVPQGALRVDMSPSEGLQSYPADRDNGGPVHQFPRYVANQLPHLGAPDADDRDRQLSESDRRIGAVADAVPTEVSQWRSSTGVPSVY